jgi:cyclopropane-fatty-acyl-phospholipid synthase
MFEHMRNYEELLQRVGASLVDEGRLFVHVFSHKDCAYKFEDRGSDDWMAKHFFTGGIMPSHDLLPKFDSDFDTIDQWAVNGQHYQKTAEAWLENLDRYKEELLPVLADCYGKENARLWHQRWRIFVLACAELWGYSNGEEWGVSHYLFQKTKGKKTAGA